MAVSISLSITQNSQSVANNTSNVTVKVTAKWTYGSHNAVVDASGTPQAHGTVKIDGKSYSFASTFNTGKTSSGSQTIFKKTVNISHNSDGTKKLSCSASFVTGVSSGTVSCSGSKTLTTIPRKSTLTVANGTLGTEQTLTITEEVSTFKHKLKYVCGTASGWILGDSDSFSTANSVKWTPPLSLAQQKTNGTSVSITFTLYTYSDDGSSIGNNSYAKTFAIPDIEELKPSVSVAVSDPMGYKNTYGKYIQGQSKLKIDVTASGKYGATIDAYKVTADGKSYTKANVTTEAIVGTGTLKINVTVTDSRGRTATTSQAVEVLAYKPPQISELVVYRCKENTVADPAGEHLGVSYDASVTSLDGKNSATYTLEYKKQTDEEYTTEVLDSLSDVFVIFGATTVFDADPASSYNITLSVSDNFTTTAKTAVGSPVKKVWSLLKKAGEIVGMAFGKIAELEGVLDIAFQTKFTGGILHPVLEPETDLNDVRTPNTYVGANVSTYNYGNCPLTSGTFTLEVVGMGEDGQVKQRLTYCHKTASRAWERIYYGEAWGEWVCVSDFDGQLLWSGAYYMSETQTATLSEPISKQRSGIVLVFSRYSDGTAQNYHFNTFFVPKLQVATHAGCGHTFFLVNNSEVSIVGAKYLYISDDKIVGNENNNQSGTGASGIKYTNNGFVLRYVIGV